MEKLLSESEAAPRVGVKPKTLANWRTLGLGPKFIRAGRLIAYPPPQSPPLPADLLGLRCGARTRRGTACKRTDLHPNGRCKYHGGCSTGPRTPEGKARSMANLRLRWSTRKFEGG